MDISIREFRKQLAYFVTLAEKGETVRIIRNSVVSAQLVSLNEWTYESQPGHGEKLTYRQIGKAEDTSIIQAMLDVIGDDIKASEIVLKGELWVGEEGGRVKMAGGFYFDSGHYSCGLGFARLVAVPQGASATAKLVQHLRERAATRGVPLGALEK